MRVGACALTVLAALIAAVTCSDALRSIGRPWSGFGMMPDASVAPLALSPLRLPEVSRQLVFADRVVAVDGAPVTGAAQVQEVVARVGEGTPLRYTVRREGTPDREVTLATSTFTGGDKRSSLVAPKSFFVRLISPICRCSVSMAQMARESR